MSNSQPTHHVVPETTGRQIGDPYRGAEIECGGETVSGRYIKVSQKTKPFFALWDACHATTMACILWEMSPG